MSVDEQLKEILSTDDYLFTDRPHKLTKLIEALILEARIDEWEQMAKQYPTAPYIPDFIWKQRLTQLKEQTNE